MIGSAIIGAVKILKQRGWDASLSWSKEGPSIIFKLKEKLFEIKLMDVKDGTAITDEKLADNIEKALKRIH